MTDGWTGRPGTAPPPVASRPLLGGESPWWSDALTDPWRDPHAPAAVVLTPDEGVPKLEPIEEPAIAGGRSQLRVMLLVAVVAALLAGALGGTLGYVFANRGGGQGGPRLGAGAGARPPDSLPAVAKKVVPSVVTVQVRAGNLSFGGSGFIVSADGYIITNDHLLGGPSPAVNVIFSDGTVAAAKVVGSEPESDVAVIKVESGNLPAVEFGDSDTVEVGDPVLAVGSPLNMANTVTFGIVSAVNRPLSATESGGVTRYYAAIQTDAAINHGNSGGPLFDTAGRVIGINSVGLQPPGTDPQTGGNIGLGFAIPINQAKRQAEDIINAGKARRTVIGAELDRSYRSASGGVRLTSVEPDGPSAVAGLHPGDVLLRLDSTPLGEPDDLIALVRKYPPGAAVAIEYSRAGARATARVTLASDAK